MKSCAVLLALALTLLASCRKKDKGAEIDACGVTFSVDVNCDDTEIPSPGWGDYLFTYKNGFVSFPTFNPNNPDELLYYSTGAKNTLNVYSRSGKTSRQLLEARLSYAPSWSARNQIAYNAGGEIFVFNPDSNTNEFVSPGSEPVWNNDGSKLIFHNVVFNKSKAVLYYPQLQALDTLGFSLGSGVRWMNNSDEVFFTSFEMSWVGLNRINTSTLTRSLVTNDPRVTMTVTKDGTLVFMQEDGHAFFARNENGTTCRLGGLCKYDFVSYLSYSPVSNEIAFSIVHWKYAGEYQGSPLIEVSSTIKCVNLNNGSVIELPI